MESKDGRKQLSAMVRTICTDCDAEVELAIPALSVIHPVGATTDGSYRFDCPQCGSQVHKPLPVQLLDMLVLSGAQVVAAPSRRHRDGPPLTFDDLIDFHELLEAEDWFERLLELSGSDG